MSNSNKNLASSYATSQINANNKVSGIADAQLNSILGNAGSTASSFLPGIQSGLSDFEQTGGISAADRAAMTTSAAGAAESAYSTAADQYERSIMGTGGYGSSGAASAELARAGSEAGSKAAVNLQSNLASLTQSGKLAGLSGASNIYGLSQSQVSQTMAQILQNYAQTGSLNNEDIAILQHLSAQPGFAMQLSQGLGNVGL